jgi:hypothetical protein
MSEATYPARRPFRKNLVIPAEHGAWSWLLVPFGVGVAVAGQAGLPVILTLIGGLCAFLVRQPAAAWLRTRSGRGRAGRADEPLAAGWTVGLGTAAALCLAGLLALGRSSLLWLLVPALAVLLLYLAATRSGRAGMRTVWMELSGAVALALMAPAALIAASGRLDALAWALWGLMGLHNALGVLYVRLRLADSHHRPVNRAAVAWGHAAGLAAVAVAAWLGWVPPATALPLVGLLGRAVWAARRPRPVNDVRRFGFAELAVEVLSGAWIAASYWIV